VADEMIHARVPSAWKKEIQDLVDKGVYRDVSDSLREAIRNQLDPEVQTQRIKKKILSLAESDPQVRKEFNLD